MIAAFAVYICVCVIKRVPILTQENVEMLKPLYKINMAAKPFPDFFDVN